MRKFGYRDGRRVRNAGNGGGNNNGGGGQQGGGAPVFTSATSTSVEENATLSHTLTATQNPTFSIVGGADQARFEISGSTLRWASNGTKDYESPDDADTNNTYIVTVRATKGSRTTDQTITVTVTDDTAENVVYIGSVGGGNSPQSGTVDVGGTAGHIVFAVQHSRSSGSQTITGVTIEGSAATVVQTAAASQGNALAYRTDADFSGTISYTLTASAAGSTIQAQVYKLLNLSSRTPFDTIKTADGNNPSVSINLDTDGALIVHASASGNTNTITFSGVATTDVEGAMGSFNRTAAGHSSDTNSATGSTVGMSSASTVEHIVAGSWT